MTIKTHIAGDHRFDGYGNVQFEPGRNARGWQLTCSQCGAKSDILCHKGRSYPPKMLYRMFREKRWKLSGNPAHDLCPTCQEKTREKHREERKLYVNGSADRLIEGIQLVDKLMTASVTTEYGNRQPDVAAAMKSLIETAYLCNMLRREDIPEDVRPSTPPEPERGNVINLDMERLRAENRDLHARCEQLLAERDHLMFRGFFDDDEDETPTLDEAWDAAPEQVRERFLRLIGLKHKEPEPPPAPEPPPPEPERIHPRTAAYLAEMRKKILGEGAHK